MVYITAGHLAEMGDASRALSTNRHRMILTRILTGGRIEYGAAAGRFVADLVAAGYVTATTEYRRDPAPRTGEHLVITVAAVRPFPTHPRAGSNPDRESVGDPGHCELCALVGHLRAHPDYGCGDVGCTADHAEG
jgi:hypothetical protein